MQKKCRYGQSQLETSLQKSINESGNDKKKNMVSGRNTEKMYPKTASLSHAINGANGVSSSGKRKFTVCLYAMLDMNKFTLQHQLFFL
jgi:hypothetical protein